MRLGTTLGIVGGIALIGGSIYAYFKKQADLLMDFDWKVLDVTFDTANLKLIKGKVKFRFFNKSNIQIVVREFYMKLSVNGEPVGYIQDVGEFVIPAQGYNDISFGYTLDPQFILKNLTNIIAYATKKKDALITLDGYVKVRSGFIRATIPINCDCSMKNYDCNCVK